MNTHLVTRNNEWRDAVLARLPNERTRTLPTGRQQSLQQVELSNLTRDRHRCVTLCSITRQKFKFEG